MPTFADSDQFCTAARMLFVRSQTEDPGAADDIVASRRIVRLCCMEPAAEFTIHSRHGRVQITYEPAQLDIATSADTLYDIWPGEFPSKKALANGLLKVQGPARGVLLLVSPLQTAGDLPPGVREEHLVRAH